MGLCIIFFNGCLQEELDRTKGDSWLETVERTKPCPRPPPPSPAEDLLSLVCEASDVSEEDGESDGESEENGVEVETEDVFVVPAAPALPGPAPAPVRPRPRLDVQCPEVTGAVPVAVVPVLDQVGYCRVQCV